MRRISLVIVYISICLTILQCLCPRSFAQKPELIVQLGNGPRMYSMVADPELKNAFVANAEEIKLWDIETGKELKTILMPDTVKIRNAAINPNGSNLLFSTQKSLALFDIKSEKIIQYFLNVKESLKKVVFSSDGQRIAGANEQGNIKIWELYSEKEISSFNIGTNFIETSMFTKDGNNIIVGGGTLGIWNVKTGQLIQRFSNYLEKPLKPIFSIDLSPDEKTLICGGADSTVSVRDLSNISFDKEIKRIKVFTYPVPQDNVTRIYVKFSPNGKYFVSGGDNGVLQLWDTKTYVEIKALKNKLNYYNRPVKITSFIIGSDGKYLLCGYENGEMILWNVEKGIEERRIIGHQPGTILKTDKIATFSKEISQEINVRIADLLTGEEEIVHLKIPYDYRITDLSPNGEKILVHGLLDKKARVIEVKNNKEIFCGDCDYYKSRFYFSEGGNCLIFGSGEKIQIIKIATGKEIKTFKRQTNPYTILSSMDDNVFVSLSRSDTIKIWNIDIDNELIIKSGHKSQISKALLSDDSKKLITISHDKYNFRDRDALLTVKIWNVKSGKEEKTLSLIGHKDYITNINISRDGKYLITGSRDRTIKYWDFNTGEEIKTLSGSNGSINWINEVSDTRLISLSSGGKFIIWDILNRKELFTFVPIDSTDWAVIAPDGRFDATQNGMKVLHYVQNNKPLPLEMFFEKFYTPNLQSLLLSGKTEINKVRAVDFSKEIPSPPFIKILTPKSDEKFETDQIQIKVVFADMGGGIDEVRVYHNEKLIIGEKLGLKPTSKNKIEKTFGVTLVPGINEFSITSFNVDRTESYPQKLLVELTKEIPTSNLFILAIGINQYKNSQYNLNYGKPDAEAFVKILEEKAKKIFKSITKYEIYDDKAKKNEIESAFGKIIEKAGPLDAFVFYYAGHGMVFKDEDGNPSDFYLILHDIMKADDIEDVLKLTCLTGKMLKDNSLKLKAQKQMIILDACHSGSAVETFVGGGSAEEIKAMKQFARNSGLTLLASTGSQQLAQEVTTLGHGVFTYALIKGLEGEAVNSKSENGEISASDLDNYIKYIVPKLTEKYKGTKQLPNTYKVGQDFPIAITK